MLQSMAELFDAFAKSFQYTPRHVRVFIQIVDPLQSHRGTTDLISLPDGFIDFNGLFQPLLNQMTAPVLSCRAVVPLDIAQAVPHFDQLWTSLCDPFFDLRQQFQFAQSLQTLPEQISF